VSQLDLFGAKSESAPNNDPARPGGSIILKASIVATKGCANCSVYSATQAAVRNFARTWSSDLRGKNIRVNAISPGVIPTPGHEGTGVGPEALASFMEYAASITPFSKDRH
jgi:NAD(P)-dependent dehydrogenase (short-subunit alcohol dehydrogenase family)